MSERVKVSLLAAFLTFCILFLSYYRGRQLGNAVPACRVCHCGQSACHRECGEDAMCAARCEGLCKRK